MMKVPKFMYLKTQRIIYRIIKESIKDHTRFPTWYLGIKITDKVHLLLKWNACLINKIILVSMNHLNKIDLSYDKMLKVKDLQKFSKSDRIQIFLEMALWLWIHNLYNTKHSLPQSLNKLDRDSLFNKP